MQGEIYQQHDCVKIFSKHIRADHTKKVLCSELLQCAPVAMVTDNPELDAQVPASSSYRQEEGRVVHPVTRNRGIQNFRLSRDGLHRRHSLSKSTCKYSYIRVLCSCYALYTVWCSC